MKVLLTVLAIGLTGCSTASAAALPGPWNEPSPAATTQPAATPPINDTGAIDWDDPIIVPTPRLPTVKEAKAYARRNLGATQYRCLDQIATRESHWNPRARNRSSGAYGIPQALPAHKMRSAGRDYLTNPVTQIRWMIKYTKARYGTVCNALAFHNRNGWY